jgi:hypothetical protein
MEKTNLQILAISKLEAFKKELELLPITIANLSSLIDNYIKINNELIIKEDEIKDLTTELQNLKAEKLNFNNVSLVKQQDKLVNDLQIENAYLKKQVAKLSITIKTEKIEIVDTPPSPQLNKNLDISTENTLVIEKGNEIVKQEQPKKRGRKSTASTKKIKEDLENISEENLNDPKLINSILNQPSKKNSGRKKKSAITEINTETPTLNLTVNTTNNELITLSNLILQENENQLNTPTSNLNQEDLELENTTNSTIANPETQTNTHPVLLTTENENENDNTINSSDNNINITSNTNDLKDPEIIISDNDKNKENVIKKVGDLNIEYENQNQNIVNNPVYEPPDDVEDMDIEQIGKVKYWKYQNRLFEYISIEKAGAFIRNI